MYQHLRKRRGFTHPKCRKNKTSVIQLVPRIGCTYHGHCEECQRTGYGGYKGNSHHSYHSSASYKQSDPDAKGAHGSTGCHQTCFFFAKGKHDKMADCHQSHLDCQRLLSFVDILIYNNYILYMLICIGCHSVSERHISVHPSRVPSTRTHFLD